MIRGKYLRERKALKKQKRTKLLIVLIIFVALYKIIFGSFSLYESNAESVADVDLAFYVLDDVYATRSVALEYMLPGESQTFTFTVSNFIDDEDTGETTISDTDMEYDITIKTTTNLPLEYTITKNQEMVETNNIAECEIIQDEYGTYFSRLLTESGQFDLNVGDERDIPYTDTYIVKITLPASCTDEKYAGIKDAIDIEINGRQMV